MDYLTYKELRHSDDSLAHKQSWAKQNGFKYIERKWRNGHWVYKYDEPRVGKTTRESAYNAYTNSTADMGRHLLEKQHQEKIVESHRKSLAEAEQRRKDAENAKVFKNSKIKRAEKDMAEYQDYIDKHSQRASDAERKYKSSTDAAIENGKKYRAIKMQQKNIEAEIARANHLSGKNPAESKRLQKERDEKAKAEAKAVAKEEKKSAIKAKIDEKTPTNVKLAKAVAKATGTSVASVATKKIVSDIKNAISGLFKKKK